MFKKIKINYINGKLRQIRFFDLPILQYEKTVDNKLKKIVCPLFRKVNNKKTIAYLKINNKNYGFSIFCLQHWVNIINELGYDFYIICDDIELEYKMLSAICFSTDKINFIKSNRQTFKGQIGNLCSKRWINAGYSHLTTYLHAKKHKINDFWNIDADDTSFFEEPNNVAKTLLKVEEYAKKTRFMQCL